MKPEEKAAIIERFIPLLKESGLKNREAAKKLGFHENYIPWIKNEKSWDKVNPKAINTISQFLSSGKKLSEYQAQKPEIPTGQEIKKTISDYQADLYKAALVENKPEKKPAKSFNEFTHERLAGKLIEALEKSGMNNIEAIRRLGITPEEITMVRNGKMWGHCPLKAWEAVKKFIISGKPLNEYHYLAPVVEVKTKETAISSSEGHKFILDIEINLTLNGRRIEI